MTPFARMENSLGHSAIGRRPFANRELDLVDNSPVRTAHEAIGFELGWDYAHYRVTPPAPYAQEPSALRDGLQAGEASFGSRTLAATRHVRKWLQLRLHAWLRGRSVELMQVTPNYLMQIDVAHCPITRTALSNATLTASDASIDRVRNDAGYAAGNLAVMSRRAKHAKGAVDHRAASERARSLAAGEATDFGGLGADEWARIAVLCSFVEPLPHDQACAQPMRVLPPNRLRLFNPVQALQAFVSQQLLAPGWAERIGRFEDLLPGKPLKRDFKSFFMALLPRVLEGGRLYALPAGRWAVEDAWRSPLVQERWCRFAQQLSASQCEALLKKAAARRLTTRTVIATTDASAIEGWMLGTRGYVPHADVAASPGREMRQARLC